MYQKFKYIISTVIIFTMLLSFTACDLLNRSRLNDTNINSHIEQLLKRGTIHDLQDAMMDRVITSEQLTRFFLANIKANEKAVNAIIVLNEQAISTSRQLDKERLEGKVRGVLHGIPLLIKDNIETRDMPTTAGSLALKDNYTYRDAPIIERLRNSGAIILGKTNLSEWANFRSEESTSGWSAVGGQTNNPHDLTRNPCGSSSGSGAAVAAIFSVAALGTETNGSIICPSRVNGLVGIKPTVGLLSRTGIVPISHSQDTAGPMARNVTDAAILLSILQGYDAQDPATKLGKKFIKEFNVNKDLSPSLKNKRIGVLRSAMGYSVAVDELMQEAISKMKMAGAVIIDNLKFEPYEGFYGDTYSVLLVEFKHNINRYLQTLPSSLNQLTLQKLIEFNQKFHQQEMPYFGQDIFELSQKQAPITDKSYLEKLQKIHQATRQQGIDRLLEKYQLDALIAPSGGPAWKTDWVLGDQYSGGFSTYPAVSGYPHITVPMGNIHGLPVGLSFTGAAFSDVALIKIAYGFEQL